MCHTIITKSIHCDDSAHSKTRHVVCSEMWGKPYYRMARCKNKRVMQDEHAEECEHCEWQNIEEVTPIAEPWEPTPAKQVSESPDSCRQSSPEGWQWSETEGDDHYSEDLMDEDTEISLEEYFEEPSKRETPQSIPLMSAPGNVHETGGRR
ncbi:hypothetical protein LTR70_004249 [Exophiala xenobiotica]|uniref:Uncharacterized protein n=1 Tax=Lithohypha guttulata TaxID=1690604 RepID=A0ABR0KF29_9EURO|nr:hypothetical protein LTR24_003784 [Lithohypha guttulata]KAK5321004.1 hypothetical protein LTR70_004249 [Exophiala xenobiotica]